MGSSPRRNLSLPISTDGFPPRGGLDILSLPNSTAGFPPRAGQPDLKGWVPGEEEEESVESSIVPSLHLLQGAVRFCFENIATDPFKKISS